MFRGKRGRIFTEDANKTRLSYGMNKTDLTPLTFLTYYLRLYHTKMSPLLLNGKKQDFFFVNGGGSFHTKLIQQLRFGDVREVFLPEVDHSRSLEGSGQSLSVAT